MSPRGFNGFAQLSKAFENGRSKVGSSPIKATGPGGVINGQRKPLLKCSFGTTFLDWTHDVLDSSLMNTESFLVPSAIFDTYATRAFQRAVSRPITLKTHDVRDLTRFLVEGEPPLHQRITPPGPGALIRGGGY